jgi:nitrous oxide reductase accessory protein NosL
MLKLFLGLFFSVVLLFADAPIDTHKLSKGKNIAHLMCDESLLPFGKTSSDEIIATIKKFKACKRLSASNMKALAYFVQHASKQHTSTKHIAVPTDAKCPVCGMFVAKYPKWSAMMVVDGKKLYFDGVKDMMKYYIFDGDFVYDRAKIKHMWVSDYYTLDRIDAKSAYYVIDSNVYGPMGNELIPFATQKSAEDFLSQHHGKKIVRFEDISAKMVLKLDGIDYDD